MKTKFFISFVICTFLFFILAGAVLASGEVVVKITTDKSTYQAGEDVIITVQLGPKAGSASPVFWTTNLYIVASDLGHALSFNDGTVLSVTDPIYSSLDKNEKSTSHINAGINYGWWVKKSASDSAITLNGFQNLASFKAKALAVSQATSVQLDIDSVRSFIQDWDAELNPIPLIINVEKASITVSPSGGGSAVCGDGDDVCTPAGSSQSCTATGGYLGTKTCKSDCSGFGICTATESCGDSIKNGAEVCDGSDLDGKTCTTQGFTGGTLACSSTCIFNTAGCTSGVGGCTTDAGCSSPTSKCNTVNGQCVQCTLGTDCLSTPATPKCKPDTHTCVDCLNNGDCQNKQVGIVCLSGSVCGCNANADCTIPTFTRCDITTHACVSSLSDAPISSITQKEYDFLQVIDSGFADGFTISELVAIAMKLAHCLPPVSDNSDQTYAVAGKTSKFLLRAVHNKLHLTSLTPLQTVSAVAYLLIHPPAVS